MVQGPPWGYFSELTKIILVVSEKNVPQVESYFRGMVLKVVTVSRYLGSFIGD